MKLRTLKKWNTRAVSVSRKLLGRMRDSHLNAAWEHNLAEVSPFALEEQWRKRYPTPRYSMDEFLRRLQRRSSRCSSGQT